MIFNKDFEKKGEITDIKSLKISEIQSRIGIRRIIDAISERKIPLVGYEMFQDLMFLFHWCVDLLPPTCHEFIAQLRDVFSSIIDIHVAPVPIAHLQTLLHIPSLSTMLPESLSLVNVYKTVVLSLPQ